MCACACLPMFYHCTFFGCFNYYASCFPRCSPICPHLFAVVFQFSHFLRLHVPPICPYIFYVAHFFCFCNYLVSRFLRCSPIDPHRFVVVFQFSCFPRSHVFPYSFSFYILRGGGGGGGRFGPIFSPARPPSSKDMRRLLGYTAHTTCHMRHQPNLIHNPVGKAHVF